MRTTLAFDEELLEQARKRALAEHVSLTKYVEAALREKLSEEVREQKTLFRPLRTFQGTGLRTGVSLTDSVALNDLMDGDL